MGEYFGEFRGTFVVVFAGTGAIIANDVSDGMIRHAGIAMTFGLIVMTMIYAVGDVSGAHLNPVVSIGLWVAQRLPLWEAVLYSLSQTDGGALASLAVGMAFPQHPTLGATLPAVSASKAFLLEVLLTLFCHHSCLQGHQWKRVDGRFGGGRYDDPGSDVCRTGHRRLDESGPFVGARTGIWILAAPLDSSSCTLSRSVSGRVLLPATAGWRLLRGSPLI
jgi:glycerol uptake facilitator-like aquaporin